jgi:excisionase family DNA binding protein
MLDDAVIPNVRVSLSAFSHVTNVTGEHMVQPVTKPGDLMFVDEAAAIAMVSVETMRFWLKCGKLASSRPGRRRLIRREDLEALLASGTLNANTQKVRG